MVEAVLFDLGGVIIQLDWEKPFRILGIQSPREVMAEVVRSEEYDLFERGAMSVEMFVAALEKRLKRRIPMRIFRDAWAALVVDPFPGIDELLVALKSSVRVFALTNTNALHFEQCMTRYSMMSQFEEIFQSFRLGLRKPEEKFFLQAVNHMGLPPQKVLYIDDIGDYVDAARKIGFQAEISDNSIDQTRQILQRYGLPRTR